ncbi:MAG: helix-turn-helix domain-containing protein [Chloroflexota bacterium]
MQITRQRIIDHLNKYQHATVDELTDVIGLTHMAVRHHLNVLLDDGLVEVSTTKRTHKPGRPVQIYSLTAKTTKELPSDYFQLSDHLVEEIEKQLGTEGIALVFNNIATRMVNMAPPANEGQCLEDRLDDVVTFLQKQGFSTKWCVENGEYVIRLQTCPYRRLASRYQEVCLLDEVLISSMLQIAPTRTDCIANNDAQCVYCLGISVTDDVLETSE